MSIKRKRPNHTPIAYSEEGKPIFGYSDKDGVTPVCNSPLRGKPGKLCQSPMTGPSGRCRVHNLGRNSGPLNGRWIDGRASRMVRTLPQRYRESFLENIQDKDYLSLFLDLALVNSRLDEIGARLDQDIDEITLQALTSLQGKIEFTRAIGGERLLPNLLSLLDELGSIVERGVRERENWQELKETQAHKSSLVRTELQRIEKGQKQISAEEVMVLLNSVLFSVMRHVPDQETRRRIAADIALYNRVTNSITIPLQPVEEYEEPGEELEEVEETNHG